MDLRITQKRGPSSIRNSYNPRNPLIHSILVLALIITNRVMSLRQ